MSFRALRKRLLPEGSPTLAASTLRFRTSSYSSCLLPAPSCDSCWFPTLKNRPPRRYGSGSSSLPSDGSWYRCITVPTRSAGTTLPPSLPLIASRYWNRRLTPRLSRPLPLRSSFVFRFRFPASFANSTPSVGYRSPGSVKPNPSIGSERLLLRRCSCEPRFHRISRAGLGTPPRRMACLRLSDSS